MTDNVSQKEFLKWLKEVEDKARKEKHDVFDKISSMLFDLNSKFDDLKEDIIKDHEKNSLQEQEIRYIKADAKEFKREVRKDIASIKEENEWFKKVMYKVGWMITVVSIIAATLVPYLLSHFG